MSQIGMWGSAFVVAAAVSLAIWNALPREEANPTDPLTITSYGAEERHYGAAEMQGKRSYMEDASDVLFVPREALEALQGQQEGRAATVLPFAFFGVFDGHGGSVGGDLAALSLLCSFHRSSLTFGAEDVRVPEEEPAEKEF